MQHRYAILVTAILLLALTRSPILSAARIHQIADRSGLAVIRTDGNRELWQLDASGRKQRRLVPNLDVEDFLVSPDQKTIAFLASPPDSITAGSDLYTLNPRTGETQKITDHLYGFILLAWRPGTTEVLVSRTVGYIDPEADGDGGAWLLNLRTGNLRLVVERCDADVPMANRAVFDPSGNRLAVLRSGRYPAVLDLRHPNRWWRLPFSAEAFQDMAWIDSNRLALATLPSEPSCYLGSYSPNVRPHVPSAALRRNPGGLWIWDLRKSQLVPPQDVVDKDLRTVLPDRRGVRLIGRREIIYSVAVSPSGRSLVYVANSGLYVADTRALKHRRLLCMADVPHSQIAERRDRVHRALSGLKPAEWLVILHESFYLWEFTKDECHVYLQEAGEAPTPRSTAGMPRYLIYLGK